MTRMFDSSNMHSTLTQSNSTSMILHSCATYATSRAQSDLVDEHQSKDSTLEVISEVAKSFGSSVRSNMSYPYRIRLEQDVQRLRQQLKKEMEMHAVLKDALEKNVFTVSCSSCLPHCVQEILSTISLLEGAISKLEQDIVSLHFHLSQERNERRLAEYNLKHSASQSVSVHSSNIMNTVDAVNSTIFHKKNECLESDTEPIQNIELKRLPKGILPIGLWGHPNLLSEEMLRCMKNIFISLADSALPSKLSAAETVPSHASPRGHLSSSSWWSSSEHSMISSWVQSPQVDVRGSSEVLALENVFDPYEVHGKLSWLDIGNYSLATEVSWMSVAKDQLEYASGALRRFSILVEQLAKVNPVHLSCNEKLAFWINLYNALMMHAYLAYGVPRNDLKLFSLMQKAAYTVGGHSFNALSIEYLMLKMKPPLHRPQTGLLLALHKLKTSEEQRKSAIDTYEPLVQFALSCGMYSSPAVRVYSAKNVKEELQEALHDFVRASVGISYKGKLLVPKMLHCFAKSFVDDSNLAVWISHHLPPNQAAFVEQCISQRRQSFLSSRNCGILPFDSRFRYLLLPDKLPH